MNGTTSTSPSYEKIAVQGCVVELDGDEMTRVLWGWIKSMVSNAIMFYASIEAIA